MVPKQYSQSFNPMRIFADMNCYYQRDNTLCILTSCSVFVTMQNMRDVMQYLTNKSLCEITNVNLLDKQQELATITTISLTVQL